MPIQADTPTGDPMNRDALFAKLYDELQRIARFMMQAERPDHTLQPTALVNEAYQKIYREGSHIWKSEGHFKAICAMQMRRILIDHAKKKNRAKRGGDWNRVTTIDVAGSPDLSRADVLALEEFLVQLEKVDQQAGDVVIYRYYGGMKNAEIAEYLGVATRTVERKWDIARRWLEVQLDPGTQV